MIEPAWPWIKQIITKKGAPKNRADAERVWENIWKDLPQAKIQAWIERIPIHIKNIIQLEGGNEYIEGRRLDKKKQVLSPQHKDHIEEDSEEDSEEEDI